MPNQVGTRDAEDKRCGMLELGIEIHLSIPPAFSTLTTYRVVELE